MPDATTPTGELHALLRRLSPQRQRGRYAFVVVPTLNDALVLQPIATCREAEGVSCVVDEARAIAAGLPIVFRAAWIVLAVDSQLSAVGLTAAVSSALAREGIACNVVAAAHHDHLFVPIEAADAAMAVLQALQRGEPPR